MPTTTPAPAPTVDDLLETIQDIKYEAQTALDNPPNRPGHTCPDIDEAQRQIKLVMKAIKEARELLPDELIRHGIGDPFYYSNEDDLDRVVDMLEDLRGKNDELRENGSHFYHAVEAIKGLAVAALPKEVK